MKIAARFMYVLLSILFMGCNSTKMKENIQQLQATAISFPRQGMITMRGRDTLIPKFMQSELKLIVYTDSVECSSCVVSKMYLWNSFIEYAKSYGGRLKYYYILSPRKQDVNKVRIALAGTILEYPVIIDSLGEFEKLNPHLPKDRLLHTFLLDENNNVILVGNPLLNKKIKEMFYKIVEEKLGKP